MERDFAKYPADDNVLWNLKFEMNDALRYLLEAYFHQDWGLDHPTSLDVVREFSSLEPVETRLAARAGLLNLLSGGDPADNVFHTLGGGLLPKVEGLSVREWIVLAAEIMAV